jgi:chemotaxis protein CheD
LTSFGVEPEGEVGPSLPWRVHDFLARVRDVCPGGQPTATIAGGANVLGRLPARPWNAWIATTTAFLESAVRAAGLTVASVDAGGTSSRFVTVDLASCAVRVDVLRQRQAERRERTPGPSPLPHEGCDWHVDIASARVQRSPHRLVAVLGSCVGIALFDPGTRIGGLAHAVLPRSDADASRPHRYVDTAVPALIAQLEREGADKHRLQAKLAGGAHDLAGTSCFQTGLENVQAARDSLERVGIPILAEHVGGRTGRKIVVDLRSFRVSVQWLEGGSPA